MNTQEKRKLSVEEQIEDMIGKNVKFEICTTEEAERFLKYNNYPKLFTEQYLKR